LKFDRVFLFLGIQKCSNLSILIRFKDSEEVMNSIIGLLSSQHFLMVVGVSPSTGPEKERRKERRSEL
jgi:hypothetical protein